DAVDDFWVTVVDKYKEKEFQSINRTDIDLENIGKKKEEGENEKETDKAKDVTNTNLEGLIKLIKEILGEKIKDARLSKKLTDSPVCLAVDAGAMDIRL